MFEAANESKEEEEEAANESNPKQNEIINYSTNQIIVSQSVIIGLIRNCEEIKSSIYSSQSN